MAKMEENRHKKIHLSPPIEKTFLSVLYLIKDLIWVVLASVFYINMAIFKKCFSFMNNIKNLEGKIILVKFFKIWLKFWFFIRFFFF